MGLAVGHGGEEARSSRLLGRLNQRGEAARHLRQRPPKTVASEAFRWTSAGGEERGQAQPKARLCRDSLGVLRPVKREASKPFLQALLGVSDHLGVGGCDIGRLVRVGADVEQPGEPDHRLEVVPTFVAPEGTTSLDRPRIIPAKTGFRSR